jgi:hypothetical protein
LKYFCRINATIPVIALILAISRGLRRVIDTRGIDTNTLETPCHRRANCPNYAPFPRMIYHVGMAARVKITFFVLGKSDEK